MNVDPLQGLRGVAALHVMFGHYMMRIPAAGDWFPWMTMPLFYLLSGYGLALRYGSKPELNLRAYFQNRFASVIAMYWLANAAQLPYWTCPDGYNPSLVVLATTLATNSWFFVIDYKFPWPFAHVSWTVCTLNFFYLVFPVLLPLLKRLSDVNVSRSLVLLYFVQLAQCFLCPNEPDTGNKWYLIVTMNPFTRLPVFIMGILGGLQTLRWKNSDKYQDPNESYPLVHDIIPWGLGLFSRSSDQSKNFDKKMSKRIWGIRADFCWLALVFYNIGLKRGFVPGVVPFFHPLVACHMMITLIIALNRSENESMIGKIFSCYVFQKLGEISYCIYLGHETTIMWKLNWKYFAKFGYGKITFYDVLNCMMIIIAQSAVVHVCIEKPLKNLLRYKTKKPNGMIST